MWKSSATDAGGHNASAKSNGNVEYMFWLAMTVDNCPSATGNVTPVCILPTRPHSSAALIVGKTI